MFPNKDTPCGRENEVIQERSRDVLDVVNKKKETAFSFVLYKILDILEGRRILQYQQSGKYSSDLVQNFAEKKTSIAV